MQRKNRFSILFVAISFLISTTGLPIWSHYCEMMGKKSLSECQACSEEKEGTFSCCSIEESDFDIQLKAKESNCCIDEFDYKKIEDDFFKNVTSNLIPMTSVIAELHLSAFDFQNKNQFAQQTNYNLPPPKYGKQLLNTLHQLKIDLPVS